MRAVRGLVAVTLAVLAAAVFAGSALTGIAKKRTVQLVTKPLFRTHANAVFCGLKQSQLVCWVPKTGYTIRLGSGGGFPVGRRVTANAGLPPKPAAFRVLPNGHKLSSGAFKCSVTGGLLRCVTTKHGFQLSPKVSYRF